jgi:cytochrome c biogenesis protein CcmG/thiol:disulfide interchange protein DsbE
MCAPSAAVVLDFWATWCAPCIASIPELIAVAEAFEGRGVRFYAVNLKQADDDVRAFVAKRGWNLTIAMDRDGSLASSFRVGAIPHTVVIDREGIVRAVFVGARPENPGNLRRVLTELTGAPGKPIPTPR